MNMISNWILFLKIPTKIFETEPIFSTFVIYRMNSIFVVFIVNLELLLNKLWVIEKYLNFDQVPLL